MYHLNNDRILLQNANTISIPTRTPNGTTTTTIIPLGQLQNGSQIQTLNLTPNACNQLLSQLQQPQIQQQQQQQQQQPQLITLQSFPANNILSTIPISGNTLFSVSIQIYINILVTFGTFRVVLLSFFFFFVFLGQNGTG